MALILAGALLVTGPTAAAARAAMQPETNATDLPGTHGLDRPLAPPSSVIAADRPDDNGGAIVVSWTPSLDDTGESGLVTGYAVYRASSFAGPFVELGFTKAGTWQFIDSAATEGVSFFYKVAAVADHQISESATIGPAVSVHQWLNRGRWNLLLVGLLLVGGIAYYIQVARRGRPMPMRRLPGVEAIDAVIKHASEAERPVLFVTGSEDLNDIQTIAGLSVLEQVGARTAAQGTELQVPHFHSLVMTTAADTLRRAYRKAGQPARYDPDKNYYVSDEQFGFVAGVSGMMAREKPATCLYFGSFFAESLALAEMGRTIGAVQIAGTGQGSQLPFLMTACDHVLIGEELFAAGAYLSNDPSQLGCLRGQDFGKLVAVGAIGIGCLVATLASLLDVAGLAVLRDAVTSVFRTG